MKFPVLEHPEQDFSLLKSKGVSLCAFLDTIRPRKDGTKSVRIRIIFDRFPKYYSTKIKLTEEEYSSIANKNPRGQLRDTKTVIYAILKKAYDIIKELDSFSFEKFEMLYFEKRKTKKKALVKNLYENAISQYRQNGQISTAISYEYSLKSILDFGGDDLTLTQITAQWLRDYDKNLTEEKNKSKTTLGIYLRPLRAIYNLAIADKIVPRDSYPFKNNENPKNYSIPSTKTLKKALNNEQLKKLFEGKPKTPEQQKAKDFWFFSYCCNGMNIKDIALLKWQNIEKNKLTFVREKTKNTTKDNIVIEVHLNDFAKIVIEKHGTKTNSPYDYVFGIINKADSEEEKYRKEKNFVKYVNQHFKKYAKSLGIDENVSTYTARHSFATKIVREGGSMEFVGQMFGHSSMKETIRYFSGFESKEIEKNSKNLLKF